MSRWNDAYVPAYRRHRGTGQAVVTLSGQDVYLGAYGSAASRAEYDRRVSEWIAAGRRLPTDSETVNVVEVVAAFRRHARAYYRDADGNVSRAVVNFDDAVRPLLKLYGRTPAVEFGPLRLKAVRQTMIDAGHRWHVHQLRHRAATDLRKQFGIEVAQVMLGHTQRDGHERRRCAQPARR